MHSDHNLGFYLESSGRQVQGRQRTPPSPRSPQPGTLTLSFLKYSEGYLRSFFCVQSKWDAESYCQANSSNCSLPSYLGILIDMAFEEPFLAPVFGPSKEGPL